MKLRRKLLLVFALTVFACVGGVAWVVSYLARRTFEKADQQRSSALENKFISQFEDIGKGVQRRIGAIAESETALRMAIAANQPSPDYAPFLNEAQNLADAQQLDFLDFIDDQGTIISSAEWPAKLGYKSALAASKSQTGTFFAPIDTPGGKVIGLSAAQSNTAGDKAVFVIGGKRIDRDFLSSLDVPPGMRVFLYQDLGPGTDSPRVLASGIAPPADLFVGLINQAQNDPKQISSSVVHWSSKSEDDEIVRAIRLGSDHQLLGAILVASSLRPYVELRHQVQSAAFLVGGAGILLAILLSGWAATRVTRPVEQLAQAARRVTAGDWNTTVTVTSSDELQDLAESFNQMTHELLSQKERLIQAERVAAWRELARRLAHELKNPLFPLQVTVENLVRARQLSPEQFDEIFGESSTTLLAEIANLKGIVSRFSEFSKMPQPQFQQVQLNGLIQETARFFEPQMAAPGRTPIACKLELAPLMPIAADSELLHRALSNLILNAIDAMPNGGTLTLRTQQLADGVRVEVSDTGMGLSAGECKQLFTPYYTTKPQGTGLGLAIVHSVISDHAGRISVRSEPGRGTTFSIELPDNAEKLSAVAVRTTSGA